MPIINLTTLQDALGGVTPVTATVTAIASLATRSVPRVSGEQIIFPQEIKVKIINGVPQNQLELTTLPPNYYWELDVFHAGDAPYRLNVVVPSGDGPFNFSELIVVDPSTALPDAGTSMANAFLLEVNAAADRAEAASTYVSVAVPTSSIGQAGDVAHYVADDTTHHYFCTGTYDGETHIWKRVAWSNDTWGV
jgi:hypothetical protein